MFSNLLSGFYPFLYGLFKALLTVLACIVADFIIQAIALFIQGFRVPKGALKPIKKRNIFQRIVFDFPRQFLIDFFERDPEAFHEQGMIIFCGRQGQGKTISMVEYITRMQRLYPKSKCITNFALTTHDDDLQDWRQLTDYVNGQYGVIVGMDELQNWFSSNQSKNFPPEMLSVITQNRKNRRVICGTAQNFYLLAKAIRSQATEVRDCRTFFGCLTVVTRKEPLLNADGDVEEWKYLGRYFYVHSKDLRSSYDTYKVIDSLVSSGFQERTLASDIVVAFPTPPGDGKAHKSRKATT